MELSVFANVICFCIYCQNSIFISTLLFWIDIYSTNLKKCLKHLIKTTENYKLLHDCYVLLHRTYILQFLWFWKHLIDHLT